MIRAGLIIQMKSKITINLRKAKSHKMHLSLMVSRKLYGSKNKFVARKMKSFKLRYFFIYSRYSLNKNKGKSEKS